MKRYLFAACLACAAALAAEDNGDFQPGDVLYAPEEQTPTAESAAAAPSPARGSYYSTALISVADYGHDGAALEGAEIFIDDQYAGKSPLSLSGFLINKPLVSLSARLPGYHESIRPSFKIPPEGEARVYMVGDNASSWYTTPSWIAGLGMIAAAVVVYSQNNPGTSATGAALVGGSLGVIVISQAVARLFHLPSLDKAVAALNSKTEPKP